jgi:hypothetical protein
MKRKREDKRFCRVSLCPYIHYDINEAFCPKHRKNAKHSFELLFYSRDHIINLPADLISEILLYNIPFINKILPISNNINIKQKSTSITIQPSEFNKKNIKTIFKYFGCIRLISKDLYPTVRNLISSLLPAIYVLDSSNIKISNKAMNNGFIQIWHVYCKSPGQFKENKDSIEEYYKHKIIAKINSDRATFIKKRVSLKLLKDELNKSNHRTHLKKM